MKKEKKKPKPRKIKGITPKQNKWNDGQYARNKLLSNRNYYGNTLHQEIKERQQCK